MAPRPDDPLNAGYHAAQRRLHEWIGIAIQAYSGVELSLCELFSHVGGMELKTAGHIFYRINNARTRRVILDKLMRDKCGSEHRAYFNSLMDLLKPLDEERNQIVHWSTTVDVLADDDEASCEFDFALQPPNFLAWTADTPRWTVAKLADFSQRCEFVQIATTLLSTLLDPQAPASASPDIFGVALAYPPPDTHPIARIWSERRSPPQSSPG